MKPPIVKYARAGSVDEAVALLREHGGDAKVLAGGQSLIPLMNFRIARPSVLIDLNKVPELDYVRAANGHVEIGAMTRQRDVETNALVGEAIPLLPLALRHVGHVTNRNRGTIGGSVAHADPASELPALVTGLGAEMVMTGPAGSRTVAAHDFFHSVFTTALKADEVLTAVRLPRLPAGTGVAVEELARRHGDFAIVAVMAAVHLDATGTVDFVRLAASGVDSVPLRLHAAEAELLGTQATDAVIESTAATVAGAIHPTGDVHAPAEYRREMAVVLVTRAVNTAIEGARA